MKDKVYVKVSGLHMTADESVADEEVIEVINVGTYRIVNGKEYVKYEEVYEGEGGSCTNLIKIDTDSVEITKKGAVVAHLSFKRGQKTMTAYDTPYGKLYLGIFARDIVVDRSEDKIRILIDYSMELNYEQISDCKVEIIVGAKEKFEL